MIQIYKPIHPLGKLLKSIYNTSEFTTESNCLTNYNNLYYYIYNMLTPTKMQHIYDLQLVPSKIVDEWNKRHRGLDLIQTKYYEKIIYSYDNNGYLYSTGRTLKLRIPCKWIAIKRNSVGGFDWMESCFI